MKDFLILLRRFIPPYKTNLLFAFLFNTGSAIFTVFSMVVLIPILEILFGISKDVNSLMPWEFTKDIILNNAYYYITLTKNIYGVGLTLIFVGAFFVFATFLKVGFAYLGAYQAFIIRNGVTLDIRNMMFRKILKLP